MKFFNIFPEKEGWFWLYGQVWGDAEPTFYSVKVIKISNGYLHVLSGTSIEEKDIEGDFWFFVARLPKIPEKE